MPERLEAVSFLVKGGNDISWSSESRKAQNNVTLLGSKSKNSDERMKLLKEIAERNREP